MTGEVPENVQRWTSKRRTSLVVSILKGETSVKEAARKHGLRRTMIGELLDHGVDLATVQAVAGHADPRTTARYDRRPDERKRAAARAIEW